MRSLLPLCLMLLGCARPPAHDVSTATRDEVRASVYAAEFGVHVALNDCEVHAIALVQSDRAHLADRMVNTCVPAGASARAGIVAALDQLGAWDAKASPQIVACAMRNVVGFYETMGTLFESADEVADGEARARWLAAGCRTP